MVAVLSPVAAPVSTTPLATWARRTTRPGAAYPVMATPPAWTLSSRTSTLITSTDFSVIPVDCSDARLTYAGPGSAFATPYRVGTGTTGLDGTAGGYMRVRFMTDAPAFEVILVGSGNAQIAVCADGEIATRANGVVPQMLNSGNAAYLKCDFGTDAPYFYMSGQGLVAPGTGYAVGDLVTVNGGTFTRAAKLRVIQPVSYGSLVFAVEDGGAYSVLPTGTLTTTTVTGSGSGATVGSLVWSKVYTTRRMRRIELILDAGVKLRGLAILPADTLLAWPKSPRCVRTMVVGDSQNAGTYLGYPGGNMAYGWTQRLGLFEDMILSAQGGTGWVTANGNSPAWGHANRVADVIAQGPDLVVWDGGQNDGSSTAVQAAATSTLNTVLGALPAVRAVLVGPVSNGGSAAYTAQLVAARAACVDPTRVRVVDSFAEGWSFTTGGTVTVTNGLGNRDLYVASDTAHLTQPGVDLRAAIMAERVLAAVQGMVG